MSNGVVLSEGLVVDRAGDPPVVRELTVGPPGPGEARMRVEASGLCHTDAMVADGVWWSDFPYVLGHEGVGIVDAVGDGVPADLVGTRVLAGWRAACGTCRFCAAGRDVLCADLPRAAPGAVTAGGRSVAASLRVGSHARHAVLDARQLVPVPADLPAESLCVIGCGVLTGYGAVVHSAAVEPGQSAVVIGCGGVGLSAVQTAATRTGGPVVAVDTDPAKRATALRLGATHAFAPEAALAGVRRLTGGHGVDHVFDAVAVPATLDAALALCDAGGTCVVLGTPARGQTWPVPAEVFHRRLTIRHCTYGDGLPSRDVPEIVDLYRRGLLRLDDMVTAVIGLPTAPAALDRLRTGAPGVRTVIRMDAG